MRLSRSKLEKMFISVSLANLSMLVFKSLIVMEVGRQERIGVFTNNLKYTGLERLDPLFGSDRCLSRTLYVNQHIPKVCNV
jgi:hypothetical protein